MFSATLQLNFTDCHILFLVHTLDSGPILHNTVFHTSRMKALSNSEPASPAQMDSEMDLVVQVVRPWEGERAVNGNSPVSTVTTTLGE